MLTKSLIDCYLQNHIFFKAGQLATLISGYVAPRGKVSKDKSVYAHKISCLGPVTFFLLGTCGPFMDFKNEKQYQV